MTVTVCTALPILPAASLAVQVTVVVPTGRAAGASLLREMTPTASLALASPMATGVRLPVAAMVRFAGAVTTGTVLSIIVTFCRPCAILPLAAVGGQVNAQGDEREEGGATLEML